MKKLLCLSLSLICCLSLVACSDKKEEKDVFKVGVVQIVEHDSLNTIREAFMKELDELKGDKEVEVIYKNASGDTAMLNTICQQLKDEDVDVIVAIATPSAQAAAKFASEIPVVFSAVSDPVAAGLVDDITAPDKNITGTSDEIQVDQIMDLATAMYPDTKTVGFLYNAGEANSESNLKKVKEYASKNNLKIEEGPISNTSEIQSRMQTLMDSSDIVFAPNDNSIASSMDVVSALAIEEKKPLFVGADSMVRDNGLATIGIDYDNLGKETAKMTYDILNGKDVKDIPVKAFKEDLNVYINTNTAKQIGFDGIEKLNETYKNVVKVEK